MAKNMTRKGLALAASFALGVSTLVSMPAAAADGVNLTDLNNKGVYGMIEAEGFTFVASRSNANVDATKFRVQVKNVSGSTNAATPLIGGAAPTAQNYVTSGATDTAMGTAAASTKVFAVASMVTPFTFKLTSGAIAADATEVYEVTVWSDENNNGVIESTEATSPTRTLTFYDAKLVTTTVVLDDMTEGGLAVGADVTFGNVAIDQLTASEWGVKYTTGTDAALGTQVAKLDVVAFNTGSTKFESDLALTLAGGLVKDTAVKAQVVYKEGGPATTGADGTAIGTAVTKTIVAAKVVDITPSAVISTSANATNFKPDSTFSVEALVEDAANGAATADPVANVSVKVKVEVDGNAAGTPATLSSTVYVEINGTRYTDATKLPGATGIDPLTLTTNASGEVSVSILTKGLDGTGADAATDSVKVTFTSELISDNITLEARDASYTAIIANHDATSANTVDGTGVQFVVEARDQYGAAAPDEYDARAVWASSSQTTAATSATSVVQPVVNGRAVFTVTDNGTGAGANVYTMSVDKRAAGGGYSGASILGATEANAGAFTINVIANATPGALTVTGYTKQTSGADTGKFTKVNAEKGLALTTFGNYNANAVLGTEPTGLTFATEAHQIAGTVTTLATATAAAVTLVGVPVTVSGAGLQFVYTDSGSKKIYAVDSITFPSGAAGAWSIDVYSNKAGKQTITVTAGGVTETVVIDDYAEAGANTGSAWDLTGVPATVTPGYSFNLEAKLTDKYGNAVNTAASKVSISWNGPLFTVPATLPDETGTDGKIKFGVVPAANEAGTYTYTIVYAGADATLETDDDVTATKSVTIGKASVVAGTSVKRTGNTVAVKVTGANARIVLNGARVASRSTAGVLTRTLTLRAGRNVIQLVVGGEVVRTVRYTR